MKQKLALYVDPSDAKWDAPRPISDWAENHPDTYVRVSEFVEIEFPKKEDAAEKHVETLRAKRVELQDEVEKKLASLDELIRTVSALPAPKE